MSLDISQAKLNRRREFYRIQLVRQLIEMAFRFDNRDNPYPFRDNLPNRLKSKCCNVRSSLRLDQELSNYESNNIYGLRVFKNNENI
jgi:hypothetical protein